MSTSTTALKTAPSVAKATVGPLQRTCACGKLAGGLSGECEDCWRGLLTGVQTKLLVGASDDPLEQEADRIASHILAIPPNPLFPNPGPAVDHRRPAAGNGPQSGHGFQRLSIQAGDPDRTAQATRMATIPVEDSDLTRGGTPLAPGLRRFFESRFGRDLSEVRVHTNDRARTLNDGLNAHAFTYGSHVWLGQGHQPAPNLLLAHELAHVIQQRQPRLLPPSAAADNSPCLSGSEPVVRRLELGLPFWVPLGAKGKKSGSAIHEELLAIAQATNKDLDVEAPAPNANAKAWGLGLQGSIDLHQGKNASGFHAKVGLFFDGTTGAQGANVGAATPKKHRRANLAGIAAGEFNPSVSAGGAIDGIDKAPSKVQIGELKPAARPILDKGAKQLDNYRQGMEDAARLTNAWASSHGRSERWKLNGVTTLPDATVKFQQGGADLKFNPASPRDDQNLVLATISESSIGGKYNVKIRFNPAEHGLPPIKGGLYAQLFQPGQGLWVYFARPKDLRAALRLARSVLVRGEMTLANQVQDQVINPLLKAPKKVTPLLRDRRPSASWPIISARPAPVLRRAAKSPQLEDKFPFADWKKNQADLRNQISGPKASADTKRNVASLELLERAYEAEEALDKVPGTGKTTLPAKSADVVNIVTGKGADRKTHTRNLADMASWLTGWTSKPAQILGVFRDKFGTGFVWVANKLTAIRDRVREKLREFFEKHPSKPGGSKGKIIAKALLKALIQVAKILLPRALHLFMDAVVAGTKKKLASLFDLDPIKLAEDTFGEDFKQWADKLGQFKDDAETYVTKTVDGYSKKLGWIGDVIAKAKTIGPILEAASIVIQCGKKPGWNCLLLLSKQFRECGMEAALNICAVQKEIAGAVALVGPLANLPSSLAQEALDVVKDAAPDVVKDIFSEPVAKPGAFNSGDIECEDSPTELTCPGFLPFGPPHKEPDPSKKDGDPEKGDGDAAKPPEERPAPQPGEGEDQAPKPGQSADQKPGDQPGAGPGKGEDKDTGGTGQEKGPDGKPTPSDKQGGPDDRPAEPTPSGDQPGADKPGGDQPGPGKPGGDQHGGTGTQPPGPGAQPKGTGSRPQSAGGQSGGGELPAPEEVHKALNELLNQQGPEGLETLAKLAEAAGMPGDEPLTAEQVKKLQELLKKGKLTPKDLQNLAGGQAKVDAKKKAKPLERFLQHEAHRAVLDQTLEKLRQKQYEYKFQEMAKLKVHWKILQPYKPGPFHNAPALMWDDTIRAAGVVDGEYGRCYDGGKIPLTVTKADMREEGTELPVRVHTPFHDKDAQLTGGVCPTPPTPQSPPKPPPKAKGGGQGQGQKNDGGQEQEKQDQSGRGQGQSQGTRDQPQKAPPEGQGEAAPGGEVDSDVKPDTEGDPPEAGKKQDGQSDDKDTPPHSGTPDEKQDSDTKPGGETFALDLDGLGGSCGLPKSCTAVPWRVDFEELGQPEDGFQVLPDKADDPDGTLSIVNPPNTLAPFTLRTAADGSEEIIMSCEGKTCVLGKVQASPVRVGMHELVSGPLLDSLRALLREFLKKKRNGRTGRAERIHFF